MKTLLAIAVAAVAPAFAAAAQSSDLVWTANFAAGASSLSGNCSAGQNGWCRQQIARQEQVQVVADPLSQGKAAARFEVKYGDVVSGYSDERALMTGPSTLWEDEGSERWYRWQALWPADWVGSYPKWDQLGSARSPAGSVVEWHHDANGGVENGSAPLYIGADDANIWLCLVDQATSNCRERPNLAPLQRAHWHDFVLHAKWSSDPSVGFLEIWIDGVLVMPKHYTATKYPGMRNYLMVGLYRNGHIGDPNLTYADGSHVYGGDGTPGVVYLAGVVVGTTQASVLAGLPFGPQPAPAPPLAVPAPPAPTAGAGTPAPVAAGPAPATAPASAPASAKPAAGLASIGYPGGGCSSGGPHLAWLALPWVALFVLRRQRAKPRFERLKLKRHPLSPS